MNVFSVAQYTKPRFKDIQDRQKIAWITGISVSMILNIVLAVLCGVWNNKRLSLQKQLYECQNSSQKTCNNTVYKARDKIILFNYSQNVQPFDSEIITDTLQIKDNGDIYINGKEATTEECKELPQEIYLANNDNNYYKYDISNFIKETPIEGNLQGTINSEYIDELVLELNNNQIWPLGNTIYFEANNTWYSVQGPQQVLSYNPVEGDKLNGALEIGGLTNPALTIKGVWGEENSDTSIIQINEVAPGENIKDTSLIGTGCKVNYLGVCLGTSPANERYYKYTYYDYNTSSNIDEYIKFVFDQEAVQEPVTQEALTVNIQNGQINIDGQQFVYDETNQLISITGNYKTTSGLLTLTGDHITNSSYSVSMTDFTSNASVCDISNEQNPSSKSQCLYLWNNTFQIKDNNSYVYKIQVNENENYRILYPDEYVNEYVNESITNETQTNKIRGNISIISDIDNNNQQFALISVEGTYDYTGFRYMRDMILTRCNFKDNNYGGAFINITSENNIESNIGINMEYRTHINTRDSNIRIGGETTLISNYTPIYIDSYVTIQSKNGRTGISVPSLDMITGNNLVCKVSTTNNPSVNQCLVPSTGNCSQIKLLYQDGAIGHYYFISASDPTKLYTGNVTEDTPQSDNITITTIKIGSNEDLIIKGRLGNQDSTNALKLQDVNITAYADGIYIEDVNITSIDQNGINILTSQPGNSSDPSVPVKGYVINGGRNTIKIQGCAQKHCVLQSGTRYNYTDTTASLNIGDEYNLVNVITRTGKAGIMLRGVYSQKYNENINQLAAISYSNSSAIQYKEGEITYEGWNAIKSD